MKLRSESVERAARVGWISGSPGQTTIRETADIETSSERYARRFSGSAGRWMLGVQERIALGFLADLQHATVLDVGGGHGQLAAPLCFAGHAVTVLGSDERCARGIAGLLGTGRCRFQVGDVIALPYADGSFDAVTCFRLLTHCTQWPVLVRELCRVARSRVIVDYPTGQSLNRIAPALFGAKKRLEGDTRTWRLFRHAELKTAFADAGFTLYRREAQFLLPMVLHRTLKCSTVSRAFEGLFRVSGFTSRWGSPVIADWRPTRSFTR